MIVYGFLETMENLENVAKIQISVPLCCPVSLCLGNVKGLCEKLFGFFDIPETLISNTKIRISCPFSRLVPSLFSNVQTPGILWRF